MLSGTTHPLTALFSTSMLVLLICGRIITSESAYNSIKYRGNEGRFQAVDVHSPDFQTHLFARSPTHQPHRPPLQWPIDHRSDWPKLTPEQGAMILAGAGERLKANQEQAAKEAHTARMNANAQNKHMENGVVELVTAKTPRQRRFANRNLMQMWAVRMDHLQRMSDAQHATRQNGEDIEHIGLSSRRMQMHMKKRFQPLPNPTRSRDRVMVNLQKMANGGISTEQQLMKAHGNKIRKPKGERAKNSGARTRTGPQGAGASKRRAKSIARAY